MNSIVHRVLPVSRVGCITPICMFSFHSKDIIQKKSPQDCTTHHNIATNASNVFETFFLLKCIKYKFPLQRHSNFVLSYDHNFMLHSVN